MAKPDDTTGSFSSAVRHFEDGMAQICRLYGINPLLGRLYAALFASPEPMSLAKLCERVGAAKSTTSVVLRRLLSLHLVRRLPPRSNRRDYYEVVPDLWAVLRGWNQSYFQPEIAMWKRSAAELERALAAPDAPGAEARERLLQRISGIHEVASFAAQVFGTLPEAPAEGSAAVSIKIEEDPS